MRVGVLKSVNGLPVTCGLEVGAVPVDGRVLTGEPAWLNGQAREGQLDVTAVSAAEVACAGSYQVIPGFCVAARGPVQSVRLFSKLPLHDLPGHDVAITRVSATSRILVQLLVPGIRPVDLPSEPVLSEEVPAVLLIGDRALDPVDGAPYVADMGALWRAATGLPMVFALWVATHPRHLAAGSQLLQRSRAWGQANRARVIAEAARRTGHSESRMEDYFASLHHHLDAESLAGLVEFYRRAGRAGLLPRGAERLVAGAA